MDDLERQLGRLGGAVDEQHAPLSVDEILIESVGSRRRSGPHSLGPLVLIAALVGVAALGGLALFLSDAARPTATELTQPTVSLSTLPSTLPDTSADRTIEAFVAAMATVREDYLAGESIVYVVHQRNNNQSFYCLEPFDLPSPRAEYCSTAALPEFQAPTLSEGELGVIEAALDGLEIRHIEEISEAFASEDGYSIIDDAQLMTVGSPVLIGNSYFFPINLHLFGVVLEVSPDGDTWNVEEAMAWIA